MYCVNEAKAFYDFMDGSVILIDQETGNYYAMNQISSAVFNQMLRGVCIDEIVRPLRKIDGCPEDVEGQKVAFVGLLLSEKLVLEREGPRVGAEPLDSTLVSDGFRIAAEKFDEIQELLLADPVHDVDVEQGWPAIKEEP